MNRSISTLFVAALALVTFTSVAHAQTTASDPTRWGFFFNLGIGDQTGDFADHLEKGTTGEFGLLKQEGDWRYGLSLSFGSWGMVPPYDNELEWGFQRIDFLATKMFKPESSLRPYLQARAGIVRLHPRSELFNMDPLPDDYKVGDSTTKASNGVHLGIMPGLEWDLNDMVALDLSLLLDFYIVGDTDLSPIGGPTDASKGFDWQLRVGTLWWNDPAPGSPEPERDAWGVRPSYGWALGEALAINFGASAFNEYVRNANFNQISPRSWWANLEEGLTYDDNQFRTNQIIHPFNGACYYNAARANGLSFWPSYGIGLLGAFHWEWMGETHPMSFNDIISTGIGGAAVGETLYRFSSMILDNETSGTERFFREAGGFLTDPIRGFNRILSGQAWKVYSNPEDDLDHSPSTGLNDVAVGWRRSGNGEYPSLEHDYTDFMWVRYLHKHGDVFENDRSKPWDYFDADVEFCADEKNALIRFIVAGNWWTSGTADADGPKHRVSFTQHFEYENTFAYEYGGQSVGPAVFSDWGSWGAMELDTRFDLMATILAGVSSDYSDSLAVVANQERFREYDYGPGAGGRADVNLKYNGQPFFNAGYKIHYVHVTNGSIYSGDEVGLSARHWLHGINVRRESPRTFNGWGAGTEYKSFTRESHYKAFSDQNNNLSITQLIKGTTPEFLLYVHYNPGSKKKG